MQFPIEIGLRRSFLLDVFVILLVLGAALLTIFYPRGFILQFGLLTLVLVLGWHAWRSLSPPFAALRLYKDGRIEVLLAGANQFTAASLHGNSLVHPLLTVFRLQVPENGCQHVLSLAADSCRGEDFRRLRVCLRWLCPVTPSGEEA